MTSKRAGVQTDDDSEDQGDRDGRTMPLANSEIPPTVLLSSLKLLMTQPAKWMSVNVNATANTGASTTG